MINKLKNIARRILRPKSTDDSLLGLNLEDRKLITAITDARLTYLSHRKLRSLVDTLRSIESSSIPGIVMEAGCALGGSAILLAKIKNRERTQRVYDVFGMIPAPTKDDTPDVHERYKVIVEGASSGIGGNKYYGYEDDLYSKVVSNFRSFDVVPEDRNVELIKGLVQDTLFVTEPVALAHIDVDWYDPVMTCLQRIYPNLSPGGSIILDDYHDWGGCRKATDEYLRTVVGTFELDHSGGSLKISRKRRPQDFGAMPR